MDCNIYLNGTEITSEVLEYNRQHSLCASVGTFSMTVKGTSTRDFSPGGTIVLYEGGVKVATYFISINEHQIDNRGTFVVSGQDGSWLLQNYFIDTSYVVQAGEVTTSVYWINKFLTEAGISYTYLVGGNGVYIPELTSFGMTSLYDTLTILLQNNGWYLTFDENNGVIIGEIGIGTPVATVTDNIALSAQKSQDDKMMRNKAIVWGKVNPYFPQLNVQASAEIVTGYEMSAYDSRAVVISNQLIDDVQDAQTIADQLLSEFAVLTDVKVFSVAGTLDIHLGETISVSSIGWSGSGLLTNLVVNMSKDGHTTEITLDQRCPRLISYRANIGTLYNRYPISRNATPWSTQASINGAEFRSITSPDSYNTVAGIEQSGYHYYDIPAAPAPNYKLFFGNHAFVPDPGFNNLYRIKLDGSEAINMNFTDIDFHSFAVLDENRVLDFYNFADTIYIIDYGNTYESGGLTYATQTEYLVLGTIFGYSVFNYTAYLDKNLVIHIIFTDNSNSANIKLKYNYYITTSGSWGTEQDITPTPETGRRHRGIPFASSPRFTAIAELNNGLRWYVTVQESLIGNDFSLNNYGYFLDIDGFSATGTKYVFSDALFPYVTFLDLVSDYHNNSAYLLSYGGTPPEKYKISKIGNDGVLETLYDDNADDKIGIAASKNIAIMIDGTGHYFSLPGLGALGSVVTGSSVITFSRNLDDKDDSLITYISSGKIYKNNIYTGAQTELLSGLPAPYNGNFTILQGQYIDGTKVYLYPQTFATIPGAYSYAVGRIAY